MRSSETYPLGPQITQATRALGLDLARVLRRARLPADLLEHDRQTVTADQFFAVWRAAEAEAKRPDLPLRLGRAMARGPMIPAIQGFAASPDVETGFARLALFKPLVAPIALTATREPDGLTLRWSPPPGITASPQFALFELVFFLELCRNFTGGAIVPLSVGAPTGPRLDEALIDFFGTAPQPASVAEIRLRPEDARRPMLFANDAQYRQITAGLRRQLDERQSAARVTARVRRVLVDILPAGNCGIDTVCTRLAMSRRSLQRRLRDEGESYQAVLERTRSDLSMHYLGQADKSVQEIAYLLAYRDPNSFYRAFQSWTGMTPGEARARLS
ncbi:AraC family transcriptional regulator ligand-binding domain-containing protein [Marimonas arenosa]|uniref:AraC family transcriptional regulator ligand-binding domain-containing protein n=1 Tax=Marimonas arenosa TaxID=1795305 RepID=A0AAE4B6A1_9RHOB|nr:AraC family transcriptional regulator ligand-binding domain-containing protein [Marimonas arenosa]MDQ2091114.1 AraC family transcriptional regulator ligand-binding domain-containing protein [Marimonas arenosa]